MTVLVVLDEVIYHVELERYDAPDVHGWSIVSCEPEPPADSRAAYNLGRTAAELADSDCWEGC